MKRCKHETATVGLWSYHNQRWSTAGTMPLDIALAKTRVMPEGWDCCVCVTCGEWLPLGPAHDDDERVRVEVRAAELAAEWRPVGGVVHLLTEGERIGWVGWPYRQPTTTDEWIGFLAAQIQNHEQDLGDVNWAGHHNADHPIDSRMWNPHAAHDGGE